MRLPRDIKAGIGSGREETGAVVWNKVHLDKCEGQYQHFGCIQHLGRANKGQVDVERKLGQQPWEFIKT
jgi:hypothetical protein